MISLSFREILLSDAELIQSWRSKKRITNNMATNITISLEAQKQWIKEVYHMHDYYHWLVISNDKPIGYICIKDINLLNQVTSWGFYIGDDQYLGIGGFIPPHFYNWVFSIMKIKEIKAYVFSELTDVIGLHKMQGYSLIPEENNVIIKDGDKKLVIAMSLKLNDWTKKKYQKFNSPFPIKNWSGSPQK